MDLILNISSPQEYLTTLFKSAVECAHPKSILANNLPQEREEPVTVIAIGKAAAAMACEFEKNWFGPIKGIAVTPYGAVTKTKFIKIIEASHPTPDQNSVKAAKAVLEQCSSLTSDDLVVVLLSGGGSSLLCLPEDGISLADKQALNSLLLKSGASIDEINTVRKQISKVKGGKILSHCNGTKIITLAISDVFNDDPSIIASGPTVSDNSTIQDAIRVVKKYNLSLPSSVNEWFQKDKQYVIKKTVKINNTNEYKIIASPDMMLKNIEKQIIGEGYDCINLGVLDGDSKTLGYHHAGKALALNSIKPTIILSGGETTVNVLGNGKGGRNSEYLLSLASVLNKQTDIFAIAADTDGIDGFTDAAGAYYYPGALDTLDNDPIEYLNNNDSYTAFKKIGTLIKTGPTQTNVNDFRAILIYPND